MPDYPGAPGRAGYAVGLDVPASVVALLADLAEAGYGVRRRAWHAKGACSMRSTSCMAPACRFTTMRG